MTIGFHEKKKEKSDEVNVARVDSCTSPVNPGRQEAKCAYSPTDH